MSSPRLFANAETPAVFDACPIINLAVTKLALCFLLLLPHTLILPVEVQEDLRRGVANGHSDSVFLDDLISDGTVQLVEMGAVAKLHFETLVTGSAQESLDDGEAATIACALEREAIAVIDEAKATRICRMRHADLELVSTTALLLHEKTEDAIGPDSIAECLFGALQAARMRVPIELLPQVVERLGPDLVLQCNSLPKSVRDSKQNAPQVTIRGEDR
mgnify:CR=1 FL=1